MKHVGRTVIGIVSIVALTILLHSIGWLSPFEQFVRSIVSPASRLLFIASVDDGSGRFIRAGDLIEENRALRDQLARTIVNKANGRIFEEENSQLKSQMNYIDSRNYTAVTTPVIGKNIDPLGRTVLVAAGADNNIRIGNPVISQEGALVGVVTVVEQNTATVRLLNDSRSRIAATLLNVKRSIGLVEGGFGLSVQMNLIPQNEQLSIGDTVVTSGLVPAIPSGIVIGTVAAIEREVYQPFQSAIVSPVADLERLLVVSIIVQ